MRTFAYSNSSGIARVPEGALGLATRPGFLRMTVQSAQMTEQDDVTIASVQEDGIERDMTPEEKQGVLFLWEDVALIHSKPPVYAVDDQGVFQGAVRDLTGLTEVTSAPPSADHRWTNGQWGLPVKLEDLKDDLLNQVDRAAGSARARYITVVPGQDATYVTKGEQALQYLADPTGAVPGYIDAEAQATGLSHIDAATMINSMAQQWGSLGPRIEMLRRKGNIDVAAASTPVDALTAAQTAITALSTV